MNDVKPRFHASDRRIHERKSATLAVEIYAYCKQSHMKHESTCLRDFSDGGISFMTRHFDYYHIGQHIKFHLLDDKTLAHENTLRACGFVVWMQEQNKDEGAWVGICMSDDISIS